MYIFYITLPLAIRGVTLENKDGSYNIYINECLSFYEQRKALRHELSHINCNDLYCCENLVMIEQKARCY